MNKDLFYYQMANFHKSRLLIKKVPLLKQIIKEVKK